MDIRNFTIKQWFIVYLILIGLLILSGIQLFGVFQSVKVSVLDVGQGDAILIQTPEYHKILIDSGPDSKVVDGLGKELGFFDKKIDIFILTHPHNDHYGGILDVMQKYDIGKIIMTGVTTSDPVYTTFLDEARKKNIGLLFLQNNQDIQISHDLYLDILYPFAGHSMVGQKSDDPNNTSIVARLVKMTSDGRKNMMIFTGDASEPEEREILLSGQDVKADVLKVGHHGSNTATSIPFLKAVNPKTAVISVGKDNKFGHPNKETIDRLSGLKVYQTMNDGTVEFNF
jgi:beta-lactamase superfamily II metal-dependent hydrolase